jgi:hypothetical protein
MVGSKRRILMRCPGSGEPIDGPEQDGYVWCGKCPANFLVPVKLENTEEGEGKFTVPEHERVIPKTQRAKKSLPPTKPRGGSDRSGGRRR